MDEKDSGTSEPAEQAAMRAEVRPATTPNRYEAHPAFQTGEVLLDPELREEMAAYWRAQAEWEKTRQGPAPRAPRVTVDAHAAEAPSEAAAVRGAMDDEEAGGAAEAVTEAVTETVAETVTETAAPTPARPESSAPIAVDRREATIEARRARADRAGRMTMIAATAALLALGAVLAGVLRGPADAPASPSAAVTVPPAVAAKPTPSPRVTAAPSAPTTSTPRVAPSASAAPSSMQAPPRAVVAPAPKPAPTPLPTPSINMDAPQPPKPDMPMKLEGAPEF